MIHTCFKGCDISSRWLDLCILGTDAPRPARHDNTADGIADGIAGVIGELRAHDVSLLVIEPSGGYERALLKALWAEGLPVVLVPAQRVRQFAPPRPRPGPAPAPPRPRPGPAPAPPRPRPAPPRPVSRP